MDHRLIVGGFRNQEHDSRHGFAAKGAMSHMLRSRNCKDAAVATISTFSPPIHDTL